MATAGIDFEITKTEEGKLKLRLLRDNELFTSAKSAVPLSANRGFDQQPVERVVGRASLKRNPPTEQRRKAIEARIQALGGELRRYDKSSFDVNLFKSKADDRDLKKISELNLVALTLTGTKITNAGLKHMRDMERLGDLSLTSTAVTDEGLAHLTKLKRLEYLTDPHTARLHRSPRF
ncbi:MAG: hypothetical protein CMJ78_08100 [Planctomycetaceae bacterium]|nr:hypothetical protein [Planctomycetaceae bacterium]